MKGKCMKGKRLTKLMSLLLALLLAVSFPTVSQAADSTVPVTIKGVQNYQKAYEVLRYTNQLRASAGRSALTMDTELLAAAMQRAAEISLCMSHYRPDASMCFTASSRMNAENIAYGYVSASSVVSAWKNSSSHYQSIINSSYKSIGIGCFTIAGTTYWVQCFGTAAAVPASQPANRTAYVKINLHSYLAAKYIYVSLPSGKTLSRGSTKALYLTFNSSYTDMKTMAPVTLYYRDFLLKSQNPSIVYASSGGVIKGMKAGTATLTLSSRTVPSFSASFQITVTDSNARTVKFDANGGYLEVGSSYLKTRTMAVTNGKTYGTLPTPKRRGYLFAGWYTKKTGGTRITSSSKVSIAKNQTLTLYARWSKVTVSRGSISKIKTTSGGLAAVSWKAVSGAKGYDILYSTTKSFTAQTRTMRTVAGTRRAAYIGGLKAGKRYYIAVRAWKTDSRGLKVYGRYSPIRTFLYR